MPLPQPQPALQTAPHARSLQQTDPEEVPRPDVITRVASFKGLKQAWTDGAAHIEVTSHLDATNFPLVEAEMNNEVFQHLLPMQLPSTRSVRVCYCPGTLYAHACTTIRCRRVRAAGHGAPWRSLAPFRVQSCCHCLDEY